jgi:benzoate-CoA ligase family protein
MTDMPPASENGSRLYNAAVDLLGRNATVDRPYLLASQRTWSYPEVIAAADAAGAGLLDLGLEPGDRVILTTRDRPEFVISFWGAIKAGLVPVPVAPMLTAADLHFILTDSEARALVCDGSSVVAAQVAADGTAATCLMAGDDPPAGVRSWSDVCAKPASLEVAPTTGDDIVLWLYTSGTTGLPKATMHRHRSMQAVSDGMPHQVLKMNEDDVVLSVSRMFFAYGLGNSVYVPAIFGSSVIVRENPGVPAMVQNLLKKTEPTLLFGVPAFYRGFVGLANPQFPASVRAAVSAGEALDVELFERFRAAFGIPLIDALGSTEALHFVTSNRPDDVVPGSAGRPMDGFRIEARDRDGRSLPEGESGELWINGPTTFAGYWRRPELTERAYEGSWMRTGDRVRIVDGRLYHEGRLDDMVKLGGIWVAPAEIEDVLRSHADVNDAAVVAIDDGSGVPVLKAYVVSEQSGPELAQVLLRLCRSRLAGFKVPQSYDFLDELPRTPSGKVRRFLLRDQATASAGAART